MLMKPEFLHKSHLWHTKCTMSSCRIFFSHFYSSQLSQSQVQVKLEPPEDGPIVALNGDTDSGDDHYDSSGMNGDSLMETGVREDEVRQR